MDGITCAMALLATIATPIVLPAVADGSSEPIEESEIIFMEPDRYQRMTVPVTISGQGPYRFMVDTGAQATVVTGGLVESLALTPSGKAWVVGMASRRLVDFVRLDDVQFGSRAFSNITAPLLDRRHIGADGILGLDSLQDLRILLDFKQDSIAVADSAELGGNLGYEIVVRARRRLRQMIITNAKLDGVRVSVIVDTGAQSSLGNLALQKRLRATSSEVLTTTDIHGVSLLSEGDRSRKLRMGGLSIAGLSISYAESPAFAALDLTDSPALILGMRDLRSFDRVAIDFRTRQILFDMPEGTLAADLYKRDFFPSRLD